MNVIVQSDLFFWCSTGDYCRVMVINMMVVIKLRIVIMDMIVMMLINIMIEVIEVLGLIVANMNNRLGKILFNSYDKLG